MYNNYDLDFILFFIYSNTHSNTYPNICNNILIQASLYFTKFQSYKTQIYKYFKIFGSVRLKKNTNECFGQPNIIILKI